MLDRAPGPGGAWQHRWSSLRLGTAHRVNDLPGMAELGLSFETADRALPAKEVVADYYGGSRSTTTCGCTARSTCGASPTTASTCVVELRGPGSAAHRGAEDTRILRAPPQDLRGARHASGSARRAAHAVPGERHGHVGFAVRAVLPGHGRVPRPAPAHVRLRLRRGLPRPARGRAAAPRRSASCSNSRASPQGSPGCRAVRSTGSTGRSSTSRARRRRSPCRTRRRAPAGRCPPS